MKNIVLVDPLMFGSRLQISSYITHSLLSNNDSVTIITCLGADKSDHWKELMGDFQPHIKIVAAEIQSRSNYIKLNLKESQALAKAILTTSKELENPILILAATDDYLLHLPLISFSIKNCRLEAVYFIRYRAEGTIFSTKPSLGFLLRYSILKVSQTILNATLVVFDERLSSRNNIRVIPDPWVISERDEAHLGDNSNLILNGKKIEPGYLLFIGRQDLRKGIEFIINTLKNIKKLEQPLLFIGKIEDKYRADFNQIVKQHSDKITHINEFVTESEMLKAFKLSCAIAIPYHTSFTSSSGVLARAAAMSKPVIATDHGLVGYRVRENKLGATIKYGDTISFGSHISNASQLPSFDSKKCEIFKNATNFNTFRKSIIENVK